MKKTLVVVLLCLGLLAAGCSGKQEPATQANNIAQADGDAPSPYAEAYSELCAGYDAINE